MGSCLWFLHKSGLFLRSPYTFENIDQHTDGQHVYLPGIMVLSCLLLRELSAAKEAHLSRACMHCLYASDKPYLFREKNPRHLLPKACKQWLITT